MTSLSNLARMAEARAGFVAGPLAAYQRAHTLDDQGLAEVLHCPIETLVHLRLCQLPRPDHYNQDIERLAAHVSASPAALAHVLNRFTVEP